MALKNIPGTWECYLYGKSFAGVVQLRILMRRLHWIGWVGLECHHKQPDRREAGVDGHTQRAAGEAMVEAERQIGRCPRLPLKMKGGAVSGGTKLRRRRQRERVFRRGLRRAGRPACTCFPSTGLLLDFWPPELRVHFCYFKPRGLWQFVIAALAN